MGRKPLYVAAAILPEASNPPPQRLIRVQLKDTKVRTMISNYVKGVRSWLEEKLELSRGGNAQNIRPMEGLRGFAALMVFVYHYLYFIKPHIENAPMFSQVLNAIGQLGNAGVDLFFVLSGYLIYGSLLSRPQPLKKYVSRRIMRIYPVFTLMFAIYIGLSYAMPEFNRIPAPLPDALGYLAASFFLLGPLFVPVWPLIPVAWSLSYEMFSYLLIPLLIVGLRLRQRSPVWRITFFLVLAALYFGFCVFFTGQSRVLMFIAGIVLYEVRTFTKARPPGLLLTLLACVTSSTVYIFLYSGRNDIPLNTLFLFIAFYMLCFHVFAYPQSWLTRFFVWTPLRWFGNMSYSFYMTHVLSMRVFALFIPSLSLTFVGSAPLILVGFLPLFFLASLVPALVIFVWVERPFSLKKAPRVTVPGRTSAPNASEPTTRPSINS